MKIDNAQLAAFSTVLREGTFEAAARKLHVTPSAVSQRIKLLEEFLGQVLIQRTTPSQPTDAGKVLLCYGEQVALLESEMLGDLGGANHPDAVNRRVAVVVNADSLDSWFLDVLDTVPEALAMTFDLRVEDQDHSAALLRDGTVMAAVSASALAIQGCSIEALGTMRYLGVATPAFARRYFSERIDAAKLQAAPMLRFNRQDGLQQAFMARFAREVIEPPTHFLPSVHAFVDAAKRGLGWGMVPEHFAREEIAIGRLVEVSPGNVLDVPLFWHRWRLGSELLNVLSRVVREVAQQALHPALEAPAQLLGPALRASHTAAAAMNCAEAAAT